MDEERTAKRSRFDQREPEPKKSRFDRRSRSPPTRGSETRERSPIGTGKEENGGADKTPSDAASAAAAAAAKINASLQARKGIQHVDVPPIKNSASPPPKAPTPTNNTRSGSEAGPVLSGEMYVADGDYIQDIEVNDLRNRYVVTKGSTQKMIKEETGADVTTRGSYYPVKNLATAANPPLYLHVTSQNKDGLEKAVAMIHELINQALPQLVDDRRLRRRDQDTVERDEYGRRKWRVEKVPVDLEPVQGFNLRAQVVGQGGAYVKHIQQETGCRVQIKGRGSGYLDSQTGVESDEDMYLSVTGPDDRMIDKAKELCEDLIANVKEQYEEFKARPPRHHGGYGGHRSGGGHHGGYDHYSGGGRQSSHDYSHSPAPGAGNPASTNDYSAQYAQYYANGQDPYAPWGGYQNYVALYQQYYGQQTQQQQPTQPAAPGNSASPPPPPPSSAAPPPPSGSPPPPPSGAAPGTGAYSSLPPPPGL